MAAHGGACNARDSSRSTGDPVVAACWESSRCVQLDGFGWRLTYSVASSVREWTPVLVKTWSRWVFTVARPMRSRSADLWVGEAVGDERDDLELCWCQRGPSVARPLPLAAGPTRVGGGFAPFQARRPRQSRHWPGPVRAPRWRPQQRRRGDPARTRTAIGTRFRPATGPLRPRAGGTRPRTPRSAATPASPSSASTATKRSPCSAAMLNASCHRSSSCVAVASIAARTARPSGASGDPGPYRRDGKGGLACVDGFSTQEHHEVGRRRIAGIDVLRRDLGVDSGWPSRKQRALMGRAIRRRPGCPGTLERRSCATAAAASTADSSRASSPAAPRSLTAIRSHQQRGARAKTTGELEAPLEVTEIQRGAARSAVGQVAEVPTLTSRGPKVRVVEHRRRRARVRFERDGSLGHGGDALDVPLPPLVREPAHDAWCCPPCIRATSR